MQQGPGLVTWEIAFTSQARRDAKKASAAGFRRKIERLLEILREDPFRTPPPYQRLMGDLRGAYSRRINIQHRVVYQVLEEEHTIKIIRMWTHHE